MKTNFDKTNKCYRKIITSIEKCLELNKEAKEFLDRQNELGISEVMLTREYEMNKNIYDALEEARKATVKAHNKI